MSDTPLIYLDGIITVGGLRGGIRVFKAGEGLPVHTHVGGMANHITVVMRGRLVCKGRPGIEGKIIEAGDVLDWMPDEPHGFEALEDSKIIQLIKDTPPP